MSKRSVPEIYDIYYDESRQESFWHGFLFVPRSRRSYLLSLLQKARDGAPWQDFISFKDITKRMGNRSPRVQLVESWLSIALASLQQQKFYKKPTPFFICGKPKKYFLRLEQPIKCKFVVFRERDNHRKMFQGLSKMKKIEITARMGLLGGTSYLFNDKNPLKIGNIVIDKFGYKENLRRMLNNLVKYVVKQKREYVSFIPGAKIIVQRSNHKNISPSQNLEDSHFLQLCDIILGGIRFNSLPELDKEHVKYKISYPCRILLQKDQNNFFEMRETRFSKGFDFQETWLKNRRWEFEPIGLIQADDTCQLKLLN